MDLCLVGRFLTQKTLRVHMMEKVINGGPFGFDGHLLILCKAGVGDIPAQIPLFHFMFWIQVHDLPVGFMNLEVGKGLGNYIGEFVEYDVKNNSSFWNVE